MVKPKPFFQIHTIGNYCANYEHLPSKMKDVCVTSCLTGFKYTHAKKKEATLRFV